MPRLVLVALVAVTGFNHSIRAQPPHTRAHAHNDYEHKHPLIDALEHGFCSVEADIYLVDGKLLVGHTRASLRSDRTLERLYLEPLKQRVSKNAGRVYPAGPPFTLFIDIKTNGAKTYPVLRDVLARYRDIITSASDADPQQRAINVVVSGSRPIELIAADGDRLVGIDGRLGDLNSDIPRSLIPVISDNWNLHFRWRGAGPIPPQERENLRAIVKKAHQHGRRIRFWATPDKPVVWQELYDAGVDLINTDNLAGLDEFLRHATATHPSKP
jgi:hypothetical protein